MKWDWLHHCWAHGESRFDHILYIKYHQQYVARQLTIVNTDTISLAQFWSCGARLESNKDEIWCSMLGSCLMRGEGKLSKNTKHIHIFSSPLTCRDKRRRRRRRGVCLPHFCQCALCVSVQYLKTTHARLCYSQLPSSWHRNWKTSSENNKESLACCVCCQ